MLALLTQVPIMRALLATITIVAGLLSATVTSSAALSAIAAARQPQEHVEIRFVADDGALQERPYVSIAGAFPGMPPRTRTLTIRNTGNIAIAHDMTIDMPGHETAPLAEVLQATVRTGGAVVYRGSLAHIDIAASLPVPPGASVRYALTIEWPDGGTNDNQYQGDSVTFGFQVRARAWT